MINKLIKFGVGVAIAIAVAIAPSAADAQTPLPYGAQAGKTVTNVVTGDMLTNAVAVVYNSTALLTNEFEVTVRPGYGLAIWPYFNCSSNTVSNASFNFSVSWSGGQSNYSTVAGYAPGSAVVSNLTATFPLGNTTSNQIGYYRFPDSVLIGGTKIQVTSIGQSSTNATLTVSNILWRTLAPQ